MNILFYAPFKPVDHPNPSGDRVIGSGIVSFLKSRGHKVVIASDFRSRWFYQKPARYPEAAARFIRAYGLARKTPAHLWLTYHTYYKSPDVFGPYISRLLGLPYAVFQGIYSTKVRRHPATWAGYWLNRAALAEASKIFTNRKEDYVNLLRIKPKRRVQYLAPGIVPGQFQFSPDMRENTRRRLGFTDSDVIIVSAAMFRPGVKAQGLEIVIRTCRKMMEADAGFKLVVAGAGSEVSRLKQTAGPLKGNGIFFLGKIPREKMPEIYSAGDFFLFPGIKESLGMVYLEAQSCGLPVIAFENGGIPEVVNNGVTGILIPPPFPDEDLKAAISTLAKNRDLRQKMGTAAKEYVRTRHDLDQNYRKLEQALLQLAGKDEPVR